ncbi:MAG: hypothetical protein PF542_05825 [Nanoarchaeota archaeon]|jgi:sugar-specific transcriptional regulator TrmB|nr:hypothetical protein [Nanoarchaeota archaeon]
MNTELLKEAGLTKNESAVYKAMLDLGPSQAGQLSRRAGLHRRTVYDTTETLIQKGLASYIIENNKRIFSAANPERLLDIIKQKEDKIQQIMPDMMSLFTRTQKTEGTNFYKGKAGLKNVLEDQLQPGTKEILILGASPDAEETLEYYFKWFNEKRVKRKIKMKLIYNNKNKIKLPLSEIKFLPGEHESPMAINLYRDKVAIILWHKEKPFAIVIQNQEIYKGFREQFDTMWKLSKE